MTKNSFVSGFVSSFLFVSAISPLALAADVTVSENGAGSTNTVVVNTGATTGVAVHQSNSTVVTTVVEAVASTGNNSASKNTGGSVKQKTGDATTSVVVGVVGGDNTASVTNPCGCNGQSVSVDISKNGADSKNSVTVGSGKFGYKPGTVVDQKTKTFVSTGVAALSETGGLKAKKNTGGNVKQKTGNASTTVEVEVLGGSSSASL